MNESETDNQASGEASNEEVSPYDFEYDNESSGKVSSPRGLRSSDDFEHVVAKIRKFMEQRRQRIRDENRIIAVDVITQREVAALGSVPGCGVKRRLFRMGLL